MTTLVEHITDSGHNWIIPTCDTGSTDLADFYIGSGILNWPTGYTGSNNYIQANWTPLTNTWYIEFDAAIQYGATEFTSVGIGMKGILDTPFYGPELRLETDEWGDNYIRFHSYDGSQINYIADKYVYDSEYTIRMEIINGEFFKGYSNNAYLNNPIFDSRRSGEPVLTYPTISRTLLNFYTGSNNSIIKINRLKASDFIPDLNTCYDLSDYGITHAIELQDEFIGSGYLSSHAPDTDAGSHGFYYESSASATISNSYVSPAIFQLIAPTTLPYVHCGFIKLDLKEFEKVSFRMYDSSNEVHFNIELRWAVETSCKLEFVAPNPPFDPEEIISQNFSIGAYQTSDELIVFFEMGGGSFTIYVSPDLTTPVATINPDINSWPNRIRLKSMNVMSDFGTSSTIDYIRLCQYNPG